MYDKEKVVHLTLVTTTTTTKNMEWFLVLSENVEL